MEMKNSTLDDISAVIGFTATLRLSAWFGDLGNLYVPESVDEDHILVKLLGKNTAERLVREWPKKFLSIPRLTAYEEDSQRRFIGYLLARNASPREIGCLLRKSERRVQQICRELEAAGLIPVIAPRKRAGDIGRPENLREKDESGCRGV